jgi:hypothetical protein
VIACVVAPVDQVFPVADDDVNTTFPPVQKVIGPPAVIVGAEGVGFTVMLIVVVVAHCPAVGVNVYVPEVVLFTVDGDHVPEIAFVDVVGNVGAVVPEQKATIGVKVGVVLLFTVTVIPADAAEVQPPEARVTV